MQLEIINNLSDLSKLSQEWNQLLSCCSASHVPFLRHEYLCTWWDTLGGGEWATGELFIVLARDENGSLIAIAPLFFHPERDNKRTLMLMGSYEISDYLDFIVSEKNLSEFVDKLLNLLSSDQSPDWQILVLDNIPENSPTLKVIKQAANQRGWNYSQELLHPCPYINLPGDWDTYLAMIDKKQRHEIRRKMRRAGEYQPAVTWNFVSQEADLDQASADFLNLMAQDPQKQAFLTPAMRIQLRETIRVAHKAGWLQLAFLEVDGDRIAGYLNFDYGRHIWVYNSGISSEYRELSPGWVLLGYLLKWANENQRVYFDFMRGDEDYKYKFGAVNRYIVRARVEI